MEKIDFKKELKHLYQPSAKAIVEVDVPKMSFLMIDGKGNPNTSASYQEAIDALFAVSYSLKFMVKKSEIAVDYGVMPLEGLWWADEGINFTVGDKSQWQWTAMIMQPSLITPLMVEKAMAEVRKKKNPAALSKMRFEDFAEGKCAQILHIGPFSEEGPTVERLRQHVLASGAFRGKHHEIYLSDIRRADPANWKTVIRQPMI